MVAQSDPEQRQVQMGEVLKAWLSDGGDAEGTQPEPGSLRGVMRRLVNKSPGCSLLWVAACLSIEATVCRGPKTEVLGPGMISLTSKLEWLEGVLVTGFAGGNIEAQLRQLLDEGDGHQEAQTEEDEQGTEELEGESQTRRAKSTAGECELESQKEDDGSATRQSEAPEQEDQAEEDKVTDEAQKEKQTAGLLGKPHPTHLEPPPKSSFGNMSDMLYDWAAQTPEYQQLDQRQQLPSALGDGRYWCRQDHTALGHRTEASRCPRKERGLLFSLPTTTKIGEIQAPKP
ncbi:hypothetical protein GGTG_01431 [Gaeumannomyces tritici R3-111a-1]|uniref:Uncharacterized protein n=1 Tax=Gaeumannomyces tritici (strain R3-111a-1) TaxID=644352 RepID=J3NJK0_GAET3|nr:hypothetical protein GGTG_01431 [Gaeumannomyces tritici R3-111a-1]EJT81452.1 hypothetical protein GGTG_01431 [Gaeumannomyces tritici R3-111a-1]